MASGPWPLPLQHCLCPVAEWRSPPPSASGVEPSSGADARVRAAGAAVRLCLCGSAGADAPDGWTGGLGRWQTAAGGGGSTSDCRRRAYSRSHARCSGSRALGRSRSRESAPQRKPKAQRGLGQSHGGNRRKTEYWAKFLCGPRKYLKKIFGPKSRVDLWLSELPFGPAIDLSQLF